MVPAVTPAKWPVMRVGPPEQGELEVPEDQTRNLVACYQVQKTGAVEKFTGQMLVDPQAEQGTGPGEAREEHPSKDVRGP